MRLLTHKKPPSCKAGHNWCEAVREICQSCRWMREYYTENPHEEKHEVPRWHQLRKGTFHYTQTHIQEPIQRHIQYDHHLTLEQVCFFHLVGLFFSQSVSLWTVKHSSSLLWRDGEQNPESLFCAKMHRCSQKAYEALAVWVKKIKSVSCRYLSNAAQQGKLPSERISSLKDVGRFLSYFTNSDCGGLTFTQMTVYLVHECI